MRSPSLSSIAAVAAEPPAAPQINPKRVAARALLSAEQAAAFDELCDSYQFHAQVELGIRLVNYRVIAALARGGWRCLPNPSPQPFPSTATPSQAVAS